MNNLTQHVAEKKSFEDLLARLLWTQLRASGAPESGGERDALRAAVGAPGALRLWLDESLDVLDERGLLTNDNELFRPTAKSLDAGDPWQEFEQRRRNWNQAGAVAPVLDLVETAVRALPEVLSGSRRATEVLFPGGSLSLASTAYQANPLADHFNAVVAETVAAIVKARTTLDPTASIRIIEIGAGTGGTTSTVLPRLEEFRGRIEEYCYTDISRAFLTHGKSAYAGQYPYLETQLFNVEKPLSEQSMQTGQYDMAIATNVLHATKDIRRTLRNVKAVLRANGLLIINELVEHSFATHLTFGLLDGWWLHEDTHLRLRGSPILTPDAWKRVLKAEGFNGVTSPEKADPALEQLVIVAESDGLVRQRNSAALAAKPKPAPEPVREPRVVPFTPRAKQLPPAAEAAPELQQRLRGHLTNLFGKALGIAPAEIEPTTPIETYGVDSILSVQLTSELGQAFDAVSVPLIFEHNTIASLAEHLLHTQPDKVRDALGLNSVGRNELRNTAAAGAAHIRPAVIRSAQPVAPAPRVFAAPSTAANIAIVGLAGRYPGGEKLSDFWTVLREGRSAIREVPADRWDWRQGYDMERGKPGLSYARHGGFLDAIDTFDPLFFRLSPRDAESMDPQERLFLETAYTCIEDAGYAPNGLDSERSVGVFVGVTNGYYPNGAYYWSIANRVSYALDFTGPSFSVDTACSSSLTAIHLAVESLRNGSCACAIAGGVNLIFDRKHYVMLSGATMLSSGDKLRAFGAGADGFVDGEGVGAVLLKPLSRAVSDGDRIYGVIRGTSINHGGKTNGYMVPNPQAQGRVIERALRSAGVDARQVSYVEAHGTGTAIGDPIEIAGLSRAFAAFTGDRGYCAIGSAKSNIGHCESAAGIAGLTKVLLQMKHGELAPSLNAETLNPHIDFAATPFVVQRELAPWRRPTSPDGTRELPRIAGISSFGGGGSNAHIVIEEYVPSAAPRRATETGPQILVLSARTEGRLRARVQDLAAAFTSKDLAMASLADVAYTLQVGREALEVRLALSAETLEEARLQLEAWLSGAAGLTSLWHGGRREREGALSLLGEDELSGVVARWLAQEQLDRVAEAWTKGVAIDWQSLHANRKRKRVQLPTYPFERTRYWIREDAEAVDNGQTRRPADQRRLASPASPATSTASAEPSIDLGDRLSAALREAAADLMKIPVQDLSVDAELADFGFDSITLAQLANRLNQTLNLDLTASDFFEARNLRGLATGLLVTRRDAVATAFDVVQRNLSADQHVATHLAPPDNKNPKAEPSLDLGDRLSAALREAAADLMKMRAQDLSLEDDLADYGFDSITLAQLANRLNQTLDLDLTASDFFEARTLAGLAASLVVGRREAVAVAFGISLSNEGTELAPLPSVTSRVAPLSHQQRRLWLEEIQDAGAAYHLPVVLRLTGRVNVDALRTAVSRLIARHEALRTRITPDGDEMVQTIDPPGALPFVVHSIAGATRDDRVAAARSLQRTIIASPFNLATDLPIRVALLQIADEDNILVVVVHHIVSDGTSMDILSRELAELCSAEMEDREAVLTALKATYSDFVSEQLDGAGAKEHTSLKYWRVALRDFPVETSLPFDRPRPPHRSHRNNTLPLDIPPALTSSLRALAKRTRTTLFMVLTAGLKTLAARLSDQEDVVIGTATAARRRTDFEPLIGFFANTLTLRTDLSREPSFLDLLQRVKQSTLDAYAHDGLRFERLIEVLAPERHSARHPLFQIMITLRKKDITDVVPFGPNVTAHHEQPEMLQTPFDLMLQFLESPADLSASVEFNGDLFDHETVERYMACYLTLLQAALANPQASIWTLPLLNPESHANMLSVCEGGHLALPGATGIHKLVARQARATPDATAVVFQGRSLSYAELDCMANRLAHHLRTRGVERRSIVAVCLERSEMVAVSLLAILKAGAAYLPLDPADPVARLQHMLDDSKASVIIVGQELAAGLDVANLNAVRLDTVSEALSSYPATSPDVISQPDDLINVIYTSGSTGEPKGVMVSHGAFLNQLAGVAKRIPVSVGDVCAAVVPLPFEIAGAEFWLPLTTGATLAVIDSATTSAGEELRQQLAECGATVVRASPAIWRMLIKSGGHLGPDLTAITAGEAVPADLAAALSEHVGKLWTLYRPTEATIYATGTLVSPDWRDGSIGQPFENTKVYIVDRHLQLVPRGVPGEICLAGAGLALGYIGQPELSGERFPHDPFGQPGTRLYRTGDLGRMCRDGTIDLLGRLDHRVERNVHRVESGKVETVPTAEDAGLRSRAPRSVLLQAGSTHPLFLFPAIGGGPQIYGDLVRALDGSQKCIGLNGIRKAPATLEALAAEYAEEVIRLAPRGALTLAGWSFGGLVALETARVLIAQGSRVRMLALIDSNLRNAPEEHSNMITESEIWDAFTYALKAEQRRSDLVHVDAASTPADFQALSAALDKALTPRYLEQLHAVFARNMRAWVSYRPKPLDVEASIFDVATSSPISRGLVDWSRLVKVASVTTLPGDHFSVLRSPHVAILGEHLRRELSSGGILR